MIACILFVLVRIAIIIVTAIVAVCGYMCYAVSDDWRHLVGAVLMTAMFILSFIGGAV